MTITFQPGQLNNGDAKSLLQDDAPGDEKKADAHQDGEQDAKTESQADDGHEKTDDGHEAADVHEHAGAEGHDADHEWGTADNMSFYLGADHLIGHVQDAEYFEFPTFNFKDTVKVYIPNPLGYTAETDRYEGEANRPMVQAQNDFVGPVTFAPTKFVVLELFAALIVAALFITLGKKIRNGDQPKGRFWNMLEAMVVYVRDQIAKPAIGTQDAARFTPFLWTIFFFILTMNLVGMVPTLGAATGSISVTATLALCVFCVVLGTGMKKMGVVGFWKAQAPHMDLPGAMKYALVPMIWGIEVFGLFIKHMVLAVRLFANMFAGHLVLAVFVAFIGVTWNSLMAIGVVPAVIGASTAVNLLELLVAFIQAYVFTFLSALFIGAAIHPH